MGAWSPHLAVASPHDVIFVGAFGNMARANGLLRPLDSDLDRLRFSPLGASFQLYGFFDGVHGRCADGWVFDASSPSSSLPVEIFDGARSLGVATAGLFRADLDVIGIADGHHAFRFELPTDIFDDEEHEIWVRVANSGLAVPGSPRLLATRSLKDERPAENTIMCDDRPNVVPSHDATVLRSLQIIADTLLMQTELLRAISAGFCATLQTTSSSAVALPSAPAPEPARDERMCSALARPAGAHDYIVFAIIDWSFRIQRPQHLAMRLAEMGNRVFYVSVHFESLTTGGAPFIIADEPAKGVFEIKLCCSAPAPIIYSGIGDAKRLAELAEGVRSLVGMLRLQRPVCLLNLPSWYPVAHAIPGATIIFDCLDHLAGFTNVAPRVIELEQTLLEEADSVIVTSDFLRSAFGKHRPIEMIRNGVDVSYFSRSPDTVFQPAARPVIGYYGAIAEWFDLDLVVFCARRHPEWNFVLIGSVESCDITEATTLPNIRFLGEKPYVELTHYLYAFDVCLIPFKLTDLTRATNPVKIYEYLCAGKPVVATDLPELRRLPQDMLHLATSPLAFEKSIARCLLGNTPDAVKRRQLWAARHSWDTRARKLAHVVARHYPPVSVIVLCFNNLNFTTACLNSLLELSDYPALKIICVDNASTDGTSDYLHRMAEQYPSVRYIRNKSNAGFAGGNNLGIRAAEGEFVILLNNDTYVTRGWLRDLIRPMQLHSDIGMTGPLTNMAGNEQKIAIAYSNMQEMAQVSAIFTRSRRRILYPTDKLAFFCVAIRRSVIETVGDLDESYGAGYFEDDDYCRRVQQAGYRLVICDGVFVHHHHSASFSQLEDQQKSALMKRNRRVYEKRWGPWTPHKYRADPGFGEG
jgi:GT2 family glycosyltransferase/glycosyltransferase involved in cell wall biosynthesis